LAFPPLQNYLTSFPDIAVLFYLPLRYHDFQSKSLDMAGLRKLPIEANSDYEMDETDDTELTPGLAQMAQIAQQQNVYASAKNKLAQPCLETHRAKTALDVIREKTEQADADNKAKLEERTRVEDDIKAKLEERERVEAETKVKLEGNERIAAVVKALQAERDALRGEGNAPQIENENPSLGQQVTEMQYETGTTKHILNKDYGAQSHHTSITINVTGAHVIGHTAGGLYVYVPIFTKMILTLSHFRTRPNCNSEAANVLQRLS
jgi:hypothetical protein